MTSVWQACILCRWSLVPGQATEAVRNVVPTFVIA